MGLRKSLHNVHISIYYITKLKPEHLQSTLLHRPLDQVGNAVGQQMSLLMPSSMHREEDMIGHCTGIG